MTATIVQSKELLQTVAASVVAGSSLGGLGSDTAGSVRIPAALSGCVPNSGLSAGT